MHLPDDTKCAIADGAVRLHLCRAGHLAGRVAVGLRHRCSAAGAAAQSSGVTRGPCRGRGSGQARCGAEARGRGSAGGVHTEILGAELRARKQVSTNGLPARAVKCHPPPTDNSPRRAAGRLGAEATRPLSQHDPPASCLCAPGMWGIVRDPADVNKRPPGADEKSCYRRSCPGRR